MDYQILREEKFACLKFNDIKLNSIVAPSVKAEIVVLNEEGFTNFILDLSEVKYCDSSGLSSILVANRVSKESKGVLVLCGLQSAVKKLIEISQLESILNIVPTYDEAMDYIFMDSLEKELDDLI